MSGDIVSELRYALTADRDPWDYTLYERAADEIERLRAALALAVGELSTHHEHRLTSPDMLMQQFLEEARRG